MSDQSLLEGRGARPQLVMSAAAVMTVLSVGVTLAASAGADEVDMVTNAVTAARAGTPCGPLHPNPTVQRVAEVINKSFKDWADHAASHAPIEDPLPGLKELGYRGSKGVYFGGASTKSQAEAIRAALLEGYTSIPDCSYSDIGATMVLDERSGQNLVAVVLAGP
ncbi:hypothetical protein [Mycobacterium palustre]|uniref:SCP domain-containing protein n=1 Tax=Mycobacterium palustre TaxID=153971 RepID=A0A1X1ZLU1_9MYCO|nr:hypothetical protein [Mycobacterium palustre]ORW24339.1 hypothetical protein AWC19_09525 [Mycobacterium palustre]